ncbi:hypothetical protein Pelo_9458 [Pelomyxa schiedti]|nr:hypothetical protein Pelo_9458 [Pelomyxa schiedti]
MASIRGSTGGSGGSSVWEPVRVSTAGGMRDGTVCSDMQILNLEGLCGWNTPTFTGSAPKARCGHTATLIPRTSMLVFGGADDPTGDELAPADTNVLNLETFAWGRPRTTGTPPEPMCHHTAVFIPASGNVFFLCGKTSKGPTNSFYAFSTTNRTWAALAKPPLLPRYHHAAVVMGNKMYVFGGTDGRATLGDFWCYDTVSSRWTQVFVEGNCPPPLSGHSAVVVANRILVWGGLSETGPNENLFAYDINTSRWHHVTPVLRGSSGDSPGPRVGFVCNEANRKIYLIGGVPPNGPSTSPALSTPFVLVTGMVTSPQIEKYHTEIMCLGKLEFTPLSQHPGPKLISPSWSSENLRILNDSDNSRPLSPIATLTTSPTLEPTEVATLRAVTPVLSDSLSSSTQLNRTFHQPPFVQSAPQLYCPNPQHPSQQPQPSPTPTPTPTPPLFDSDAVARLAEEEKRSRDLAQQIALLTTEKNTIMDTLNRVLETNVETKKELEELHNTKCSLNTELDSLRELHNTTTNEVTSLHTQLTTAQALKEKLELMLTNQNVQLQQMEQMKIERDTLLESNDSSVKLIASLRTEIETIRQENNSLSQNLDNRQTETAQSVEKTFTEIDLRKLEEEKIALVQNLETLKMELSEERSCKNSITKEKMSIEEEVSKCKLQYQEEIISARQEITTLQQRLSLEDATHKQEAAQLKQQLELASARGGSAMFGEAEYTSLQSQLEKCLQQLAAEQEVVTALRKELLESTRLLEEQENKSKMSEEHRIQLEKLTGNYSDLTSRHNNLKTILECTKRDRDDLQCQLTQQAGRIEEYEKKLKDNSQVIEGLVADKLSIEHEYKQMQELQQNKTDSGTAQSEIMAQIQTQAVQLTELHLRVAEMETLKDALQSKCEAILQADEARNKAEIELHSLQKELEKIQSLRQQDLEKEREMQNAINLEKSLQNELQSKLRTVENERDTTKAKLVIAEQALIQYETAQKALQADIQKERDLRTAQITELKALATVPESTVKDPSYNDQLERIRRMHDVETASLQMQLEEALNTISRQTSDISEAQLVLEGERAESREMKSTITKLNAEILEYQGKCQLVDTSIGTGSLQTEEMEKVQAQLSSIQVAVDTARGDVLRLETENQNLRESNQEKALQAEVLTKDLSAVRSTNTALEMGMHELHTSIEKNKQILNQLDAEKMLFVKQVTDLSGRADELKMLTQTLAVEREQLRSDLANHIKLFKAKEKEYAKKLTDMKTALIGAQNDKKTLESERVRLERENRAIKADVDRAVARICQSKSEYKELELYAEQLQSQFDETNLAKVDIQTKFDKLCTDYSMKSNELEEISLRCDKEVSSRNAITQELQSKLDKAISDLAESSTKHTLVVQSLQQQIENLSTELSQSTTAKSAAQELLQTKIARHIEEQRELQSKIENLTTNFGDSNMEESNQNLHMKIAQLNTDIETINLRHETEKSALQSKISQLSSELAQSITLCREAKASNQPHAELMGELIPISHEPDIQVKHDAPDTSTSLNETKNCDTASVQTELQTTAIEISKLSEENSQLKIQIESINKLLQQTKVSSEEDLAAQSKEIQILQEKINSVCQQNAESARLVELKLEQEVQEKKTQIENLGKENTNLQEVMSSLKSLLTQAEAEIQANKAEKKNFEEEILKLQASVVTLDENCKLLSSALAELQQQSSPEAETLKQQLEVLTQEFNNIQENRDQWKSAAEAMEQLGRQSVVERDATIAELTAQKERLENTLATVEQKNESLDRMLKKLTNLKT